MPLNIFLFEHHLPIRASGAVHVVRPVTDPEPLVEGGHLVAHVGDPAPRRVTEMKDLAVELEVRVEPDGLARAVERERRVGELLPALHLEEEEKNIQRRMGEVVSS